MHSTFLLYELSFVKHLSRFAYQWLRKFPLDTSFTKRHTIKFTSSEFYIFSSTYTKKTTLATLQITFSDSVQATPATSTSGPSEPNHYSKSVDEMSVFDYPVVGQQYDFQYMYGAQQFVPNSEHLAPNYGECPYGIDHLNQQGDVQNPCDLGQNWENAGHFFQYVPSQEYLMYSRSEVKPVNKLFQKGSCAMNNGGLIIIKTEELDDCYNEYGAKSNV